MIKPNKKNTRDKTIICRLSSVCLAWLIMLSMPGRAQNLRFVVIIVIIVIIIIIIRCYVCGGNSGTPCGQGNGEVQIITSQLIQLIQVIQVSQLIQVIQVIQASQLIQVIRVRSRCITTSSSHYSTLFNLSVLSGSPSGIGRRRGADPRPCPGVQRSDQQPRLCQAVRQQR